MCLRRFLIVIFAPLPRGGGEGPDFHVPKEPVLWADSGPDQGGNLFVMTILAMSAAGIYCAERERRTKAIKNQAAGADRIAAQILRQLSVTRAILGLGPNVGT